MKYVLDENGNIKIGQKGHPIVLDDDDKEFEIDALKAQETITNLHAESAGHRKKASDYKKIVDKVGNLDLDAAAQALNTVSSMSEDHKLEVEKLKQAMNDTWQQKYDAAEAKTKQLSEALYDATVTTKFATSPVVKSTILTPDIAAKFFGPHFTQEGHAIDFKGNTIYSKERPGEPADFDEALQTLINQYPNKDAILKGSGAGGSGGHRARSGVGGEDFGKYYDKASGAYSLTEQSKIANTNPTLHQQLSSTFSK